MWIFGYGSLMFDEWESNHGCVGRRWADLAGYRRVFNKKSVENWGTKEWPGLTLNLKESTNSVCRGIAFAFADDDSESQDMLKRLTKREACQPRSLGIRLQDGRDVSALVYIYEGRNILEPTTPLAEKAGMVVRHTIMFKIDYLDQTMSMHSPDPADPADHHHHVGRGVTEGASLESVAELVGLEGA